MKFGHVLLALILLANLLHFSASPGHAQGVATVTIAPNSYTTLNGTDGGQPVSNLFLQDQTGQQNEWSKYVEFNTPGAAYSGYRSYTLPNTINSSTLTALQVKLNNLGPEQAYQTWRWHIYNWVSGQWVFIGDNNGALSWQWKQFTFNATGTLANYVEATTREIRIRVESLDDKDDMDLDYEAIIASYNNNSSLNLSQKLALPAYFDPPSDYWTQIERSAAAVGLVIINPDSGPGATRSQAYVSQFDSTRAKGILAIGYVYTKYSERLLSEVKADIDKYYEWYKVDGIFLDEVHSADCTKLDYYRNLYDYIKGKDAQAQVAINPGTIFPECLMAVNTIAFTFDHTYNDYLTWQPQGWESKFPAERFGHFIYETPLALLPTAIVLAKAHRIGWIYITPDTAENPWDTLPDEAYWQEEIRLSGATLFDVVEPVPGDSVRVTDPITDLYIGGYVYLNGKPVDRATVAITDKLGHILTAQTGINQGTDQPFFLVKLESPLQVAVGDTITLTSVVMGQQSVLPYRVQPGLQQVDLVLPSTSAFTRPIATITQIQPRPPAPVNQGQNIVLRGMGQDSDATPIIAAYKWESDLDGELGSIAEITRSASTLKLGDHHISFAVQDNEGVWSTPLHFTLTVTPRPQNFVHWTLLLYLAGDYDGGALNSDFWRTIKKLNTPKLPTNVNLAILVDGPDINDSYRITSTVKNGTRVFSPQIPVGEAAMDNPNELTQFIKWGQTLFPKTHYYLAIADHGQAVRGIAWDFTSDKADDQMLNLSAYLSTKELGEALQQPGIQPIDLIHLDACSMGALEVAYELKDVATLLITSQYLGWTHFAYLDYASLVSTYNTPEALARSIAESYATKNQQLGLPYTIAVLNLQAVNRTNEALSALAAELKGLVKAKSVTPEQLDAIRNNSQFFTSDGDYQNDPAKDVYVDLVHWTTVLSNTIPLAPIREKSASLLNVLTQSLVLHNATGTATLPGEPTRPINLDQAKGVTIFYPPNAMNEVFNQYIEHKLFSFTQVSAWPAFLHSRWEVVDEAQREDAPPPLELLNVREAPNLLYLPLVVR